MFSYLIFSFMIASSPETRSSARYEKQACV
nr:MAG TPA: hypothetical protein [Caudoviricetes sp.]DAU42253.1 MAG TPA: hypothetical protein [Caudoviricetes sp.]